MSEGASGDQSRRLVRWVEMQKATLEFLETLKSRLEGMDRLEMVVYARLIFQHLEKTVKAFDEWLQDPFIATIIPREEMARVLAETIEAAEKILRLDITHTDYVRGLVEKAAAQGTHPLLRMRQEEKVREGRSLSM